MPATRARRARACRRAAHIRGARCERSRRAVAGAPARSTGRPGAPHSTRSRRSCRTTAGWHNATRTFRYIGRETDGAATTRTPGSAPVLPDGATTIGSQPASTAERVEQQTAHGRVRRFRKQAAVLPPLIARPDDQVSIEADAQPEPPGAQDELGVLVARQLRPEVGGGQRRRDVGKLV